MKTDSLFYRLFQELPSSFFELIGDRADAANSYKFDSIELKETALRIDGVFLPVRPDDPIYFTEVQFQKDIEIYARLFSEVFLYLRKNSATLPWRAVVIFKSRAIEPSAEEREPYLSLLNSDRVTRIYLNEIEVTESAPLSVQVIQLIVLAKNKVRDRVRQLVRQTKQEVPDDKARARVLDLIQVILAYKLPNLSRKELKAMFAVEDLKKARFVQEYIAEGKIEGEIEGERKGAMKTKLELIPRLRSRGFAIEEIADLLELELEEVRKAIADSERSEA